MNPDVKSPCGWGEVSPRNSLLNYSVFVCVTASKFSLAFSGKGGKNRRRGKNENEEKRELTLKDDGQEYAQVLRMLGNGRLEAFCFDGKKRLCHIRGKMRKKVSVL